MNEPYPQTVNVTPPPDDPKATKKLFHEMGKRGQWSLYGGDKDDGIMPPSDPPPPTGGDEGDDEELPIGSTFEIRPEQYEELVVKPDPEDTHCWRCGTEDGVRKLQNGATLCVPCQEILKP